MALYLDNQTRPYLERKFKDVAESDFIGKRVQKMLADDRSWHDDMAECDHIATDYVGVKTCCGKCGAFYEEGMGQTWTMKVRK